MSKQIAIKVVVIVSTVFFLITTSYQYGIRSQAIRTQLMWMLFNLNLKKRVSSNTYNSSELSLFRDQLILQRNIVAHLNDPKSMDHYIMLSQKDLRYICDEITREMAN